MLTQTSSYINLAAAAAALEKAHEAVMVQMGKNTDATAELLFDSLQQDWSVERFVERRRELAIEDKALRRMSVRIMREMELLEQLIAVRHN